MGKKGSAGMPGRIMIVRHAEKPGIYGDKNVFYNGVNAVGNADAESLVTLGWERAGGLAALFDAQTPLKLSASTVLTPPTVIYASDPLEKLDPKNGADKEPSQRPFQTISALASKLGITPDIKFKGADFQSMVTDALTNNSATDTVLISWQHQDILTKEAGADSIVAEIVRQTRSSLKNLPTKSWPGDRYDMVLVFDQVNKSGQYTRFTQVPQMLLAGDISTPFK